MPGWIIAAAVGSIVITALLTFVLWRLNAPALADDTRKRGDSAGDGAWDGGGRRHDNDGTHDDSSDGGSDGGGGDGGGD